MDLRFCVPYVPERSLILNPWSEIALVNINLTDMVLRQMQRYVEKRQNIFR